MKNQLEFKDKFLILYFLKDPVDRFLVKMDSFFGHNIGRFRLLRQEVDHSFDGPKGWIGPVDNLAGSYKLKAIKEHQGETGVI